MGWRAQDGLTAVAPADETRHTSPEARAFASAMTAFLRERTTLPPWDKRVQPGDGFWRLLLVRNAHRATFFPRAQAEQQQQQGAGGGGAATLEQLDPYRFLVQIPVRVWQVDVRQSWRDGRHATRVAAGRRSPLVTAAATLCRIGAGRDGGAAAGGTDAGVPSRRARHPAE